MVPLAACPPVRGAWELGPVEATNRAGEVPFRTGRDSCGPALADKPPVAPGDGPAGLVSFSPPREKVVLCGFSTRPDEGAAGNFRPSDHTLRNQENYQRDEECDDQNSSNHAHRDELML
jgi:hypothetical protein